VQEVFVKEEKKRKTQEQIYSDFFGTKTNKEDFLCAYVNDLD